MIADSSALLTRLQRIVEDLDEPLASLSAAVVRGGELIADVHLGRKRIDQHNPAGDRPVDRRTLFRIASISKLITTIGVMRLVESNQLQLESDVSESLGFRLRNPHFPDVPITLAMLLSHTSSLRDAEGYFWDAASGLSLSDVLMPGGRGFGRGRMWASNAPPGEYFQYANLPWGVIGTMMERVTGERFDRLMRRLVLDPLGLRGGFSPSDFTPEELDDLATLYRKRSVIDGREVWNPAGPWVAQTDDYTAAPPVPRAGDDYVPGTNGTLFGPQGNCRLSVMCLYRVLSMLFRRGQFDGRQVLCEESIDLMLQPHWQFDPARPNGNTGGEFKERPKLAMNAWGLGVQIFTDVGGTPGVGDRLVEGGGFRAVGHFGDAYGLRSALAFDPQSGDGMIFLVGGVGFDPDTTPGRYSANARFEERILTCLHGAIQTLP